MSELTDSQKEFVVVINTNVLLSASAGSGKTTTMVAKLTNLIVKEHVPIKNILTLTFTRAAANEMRQKLYGSLSEALSQNIDDQFLMEQIEYLNLADIGTIDSLCNKIVKKYFYVIGIDPSFDLLDEEDNNFLCDKTIVDVCNSLQNEDGFFELYESFLAHRSPRPLYDTIKSIINFLLVMPNYNAYCDYVVDTCYNSDLSNNICANYLLNYCKSLCEPLLPKFETLSVYVKSEHENYQNYVLCRLGLLKELCEATNYVQACKILVDTHLPAMPRNKIDAGVKSELDDAKIVFDDVYSTLTAYFVMPNSDEFEKTKLNVKALLDIARLVIEKLRKIKDVKSKYSFSDIEHFAFDILKNENVRQELSQGYKYIFFDEYQDINELQDGILKLLSNNNLNLIGDVKQSIYEFRQSTPELFVEKFDLYQTGKGQVINLNNNFRSSNNILQFVNLIFDKLITVKTLGIDYKSFSRLEAGLDSQIQQTHRVELNIINKDNIETAEDETIDYLDAEINLIINKIYEYTKLGYLYSDIAVLLRDRGDMAVRLGDKLKQFNIPCAMDIGMDIFAQPHIRTLYSLLKVLSNYRDDISLSSVLLSPICGFDENDLVEFATFQKDSFYSNIAHYNKPGELCEKLNKAKDYYRYLLKYSINHNPCDVIKKVITDCDLYNYYLSMPDGVELVKHIDVFVGILARFDNITSAVNYIDSIDGTIQKINIVPNTKNYVTISTIHSSKGLEYKCVILANTGRNIRFEKNSAINLSKRFGLGIKYFDTDNNKKHDVFVKNACLLDNNTNRINEEIRLLYVALTRAKEYLCVVGTASIDKLVSRHTLGIYNCKNYLDFIFKGLDNLQINKFSTSSTFVLNEGKQDEFVCKVYDNFDVNNQGVQSLELNTVDKDLAGDLVKLHTYTYPFAHSQNIAQKNSVTSILHEEEDYVNTVEDMSSLLVGSVPNIDSLSLGTAYHAIMQQVDYKADNSIEAIIDKLKTSGELTEELCALIDVTKIEKAINEVKQFVHPDSVVLKEQQFTMRGKHSEFVEGGEDVNTIIQGVIDLAIVNDDGITLIDFKTNKTNATNLIKMYGRQLSLYAAALEKHEGVKVKNKLLYSFYLQKFVR